MNTQGLFSTGGGFPGFTTSGKWWLSKVAVKAHLAIIKKSNNRAVYDNCLLVTYEMEAKDSCSIDILFTEIENNKPSGRKLKLSGEG